MTQDLLDQAREMLRTYGVVLGEDGTARPGAMTAERWREFFEVTSAQGVYDPGLNWRKAFDNSFVSA